MSQSISRYIARLFSALAGKEPSLSADSPGQDAGLRARIAGLEMDIKERDQRIQSMQKEYSLLDAGKQRSIDDAGSQQMEKLFKKLSGPLSNAAVLSSAVKEGKQVAVQDVTQLLGDIEKELSRFGLIRIGAPGEQCTFDTALHQRLSGSSVHSGTPVTVRVPGYKMGDRVLMKVMVTTREE